MLRRVSSALCSPGVCVRVRQLALIRNGREAPATIARPRKTSSKRCLAIRNFGLRISNCEFANLASQREFRIANFELRISGDESWGLSVAGTLQVKPPTLVRQNSKSAIRNPQFQVPWSHEIRNPKFRPSRLLPDNSSRVLQRHLPPVC